MSRDRHILNLRSFENIGGRLSSRLAWLFCRCEVVTRIVSLVTQNLLGSPIGLLERLGFQTALHEGKLFWFRTSGSLRTLRKRFIWFIEMVVIVMSRLNKCSSCTSVVGNLDILLFVAGQYDGTAIGDLLVLVGQLRLHKVLMKLSLFHLFEILYNFYSN